MLGDSLLVSSSTLFCQALAAATSLLLRFALSPAQMGVWQALKLFLGYANYANLGISKGATRELSVALGRGDGASAYRGLNLAFTVNTLSSLVYAAALAAWGLSLAISSGRLWTNPWALGLLALAIFVVIQRHVTFLITILRCRQQFALTARLSLIEALLTLALVGAATWLAGLNGLYGGTLAVLLASWFYLRQRGGCSLAWAWNFPEIRRLIGLGGPILLSGAAATLFQSLDKLMILASMSDREYQLGCYSLALLVGGQLFGFANMLSIVMGPRYSELFGRCGRRTEVARLAARASELQAAALALPSGLALVAVAPLLGRLLPDYRPGVAPAMWLIPGAVAMGLSLPANQYLVAVYRERSVLASLLAACGLAALANHLALTAGHGLVGVALATSFAYLVYLVLMLAISLWPELSAPERRRYLGSLAVALIPTWSVALLVHLIWPAAGWRSSLLKALAVTAAWALTASYGWLHGGWKQAWRQGGRS
ncbi:MAG: oligosaccharide flippase family protein [Pirellulales bacterium]